MNNAELAARKLGAWLCEGCGSRDCYGCSRSKRVMAIISGDIPDAIAPARAWVERMEHNGFRRVPSNQTRFSIVAGASRRISEPSLPYDDHPMMWRKTHVGAIYTSQPYLDWSLDVKSQYLAEMKRACDDYCLKMVVSDELSWWYPKKTTLVIIGKPAVLQAAGLDEVAEGTGDC